MTKILVLIGMLRASNVLYGMFSIFVISHTKTAPQIDQKLDYSTVNEEFL